MAGKPKDLTGQRFGRLVAIKDTGERSNNGGVLWECRCDCGSTTIVRADALVSGNSQSCRCFHDEKFKDVQSKYRIDGTSTILINPQRTANKNSNTGIRGVSPFGKTHKWRASIGFKGSVIHLGLFDDINDAITARKEAEEIYFKPTLDAYKKE